MNFTFGKESDIDDFLQMTQVSLAHLFQNLCMILGLGQVVDLIRILFEIIELFGWLGFPKMALGLFELPFIKESLPNLGGGGNEHVAHMLAVEFVGHVIPDIDIALSNYRPDHIVSFVHASTKPIAVFLFWSLMFTKESVALEVSGWLLSGDAEQGGGKVHKSNPSVAASSDFEIRGGQMFPFFR